MRHLAAGVALLGTALYFFLLPAVHVIGDLLDPALGSGTIPDCAWRWHRSLTPRYETWARARIGAGSAVDLENVPATEWPMFGSVFFLVATESLQDAYDAGMRRTGPAPRAYASAAIDAAAAVVIDPANAAWVRAQWGDDYLRRENVFYRMLLIMGLTSHVRLTNEETHLPILRQQVESLAAELDQSPHGMLDDYPGEAYPTDVVWAVAAIRRADRVLATDHGAFVDRFLNKCRQPQMTGRLGLLPYQIDARAGRAFDDSRGCSNSGLLIQAPSLSVEQSREWYQRYAEHFWQRRALAVGFTEFPRSDGVDRWWDVDAGPVVFGYGFAASAFGLAAARANGRFDHAAPLAALAVAGTWQLPDGSLLLPRRLSDLANAPLLGEAAMVFIFTRTPEPGVDIVPAGSYPWLAYLLAGAYVAVGAALAALAFALARRANLAPRHGLLHEVAASITWLGLVGGAYWAYALATRGHP